MSTIVYGLQKEYSLPEILAGYADSTMGGGFPFVDDTYPSIPPDLADIIIQTAKTYADKERPPQITTQILKSGNVRLSIVDMTREAYIKNRKKIFEYFDAIDRAEGRQAMGRFCEKQQVVMPHTHEKLIRVLVPLDISTFDDRPLTEAAGAHVRVHRYLDSLLEKLDRQIAQAGS